MKTKKIIPATMIYYPELSNHRIAAFFETCSQFKKHGFDEVVIIDGGSHSKVLLDLEPYGFKVINEKEGAAGGWLQVIQEASKVAGNSGLVFKMEAEKHSIVEFIKQIAEPIIYGQAEMSLPVRKDRSTYPFPQLIMESFGLFCERLLLKPILGDVIVDGWFGPWMVNASALKYFLNYDGAWGNEKWQAMTAPWYQFIFENPGSIASVSVDYSHPIVQRDGEQFSHFVFSKLLKQMTLHMPLILQMAEHYKVPAPDPKELEFENLLKVFQSIMPNYGG